MESETSTRRTLDLWWIPAIAGVVLLSGGTAVILWPGITVRVAARGIGLVLTASGTALVLSALAALRVGYDWAVLGFEALWAFALGIPLLLVPETSVRALALVVGVLLLIGGSLGIVSAATLAGHLFGPGRYLLRGLVGLTLGGFLILFPGTSITSVTVVAGAWMLAVGVLLLLQAFALAGYGNVPPDLDEKI